MAIWSYGYNGKIFFHQKKVNFWVSVNHPAGPYHQKQYNSIVKRRKSEIRSKDPFQDFVSIINGGIICEDEFRSITEGLVPHSFKFFQFLDIIQKS